MKNLLALLFAGLLIASTPGCAKPVDKANDPVPGLDIEGVPSFDDDTETADDSKTK